MDVRRFNWDAVALKCNLVTSIFTLQFIPKRDRITIVKQIYNVLPEGGAFIFSEKILSSDPQIEEMMTFCYYDWKRKHFSEKQILEKNYCIRIKIPNYGQLSIADKIQGKVTIENKEIDNFVLLRKDGTPTYMLSVVVDDHEFKVNTIIRGDDHINNTFRQQYIYKYLKWNIPEYAHLPLIHGRDGSKLSKRHGAVDINEFKKLGYLPQSIINNLILLGWSPKKNDEIIEINEIIEIFEIKKMSKSSSIFDYNKLNYFNNYYLRKEENYSYFEEFIKNEKDTQDLYLENKEKIKKIYDTYKQYVNSLNEFPDIIKIYFNNSFETVEDNILETNINPIIGEFMIFLDKINVWNQSNLENNIIKFIENKKIKFSMLGKPIRYILTNNKNGPPIYAIIDILGKEKTFFRLNKYIKRNY